MYEEIFSGLHDDPARHLKIFHEPTDFTKLTSEDYPILSDLYRVIEEKLESYDEEAALAAKAGHPVMYSLEMLKSVGLGLRGICIGAMSRYFNGHTNIPNSNFIDFWRAATTAQRSWASTSKAPIST